MNMSIVEQLSLMGHFIAYYIGAGVVVYIILKFLDKVNILSWFVVTTLITIGLFIQIHFIGFSGYPWNLYKWW